MATRQFAGLVLAPIEQTRLGVLKELLARVDRETVASMRGHAPAQLLLPFSALETVHYARFVLLDAASAGRPTLAFCTDYDGPEGARDCSERRAYEGHLDDLERNAGAGLERIFGCCEGFRSGELRAYLTQHRIPASTFYVGSSGRSKQQILWEAGLRRQVEAILDQNDWRDLLPEQVRERVLAALPSELRDIPEFPPQPDLEARVQWFTLRLILLVLAAVAAVVGAAAALLQLSVGGVAYACLALLAVSLLLVARFRYLERTDPQFQPEYVRREHEHFTTAAQSENEFLQNQLTHLVAIKPGPLRWLLIRAVFTVLQVVATNTYNKGKLGNIPSIHFARWVLIPKRGVLFFSNFDSSWQSYLGDFIDQASAGLTAVWSNTLGYPRTTWLLKAGSRDASRFLAWTRHHQLPTQVWYCAYPGLSIVNVNDNTEIRRGLADRSAVDATTWLFHLRGVQRVATDQQYGEEQTRDPSLPLEQIQGLILWGYGHQREARFLLFRVAEPASAKLLPWLGQLELNSAAASGVNDTPDEPLLNLAFTHRGLRALGVDERLCSSFSTPFFQGSEHEYRARVNGDVGASAPEHWAWGSESNPVHLALFVYANSPESVARFARQYTEQAVAAGLELVSTLDATTLEGRKEHFGFRDGIAQPTIQGSGRAELAGNTLAAGEFLLGHRDGYGNVTHSPESANGFNFGLNGSYLVMRQLEQDVEGFWRYCANQVGQAGAIELASKMVGRWPSGAPLLRHPESDPDAPPYSDEDNFTYIANDEDNDRYGARCPFGSHIRRTNPRDWQLGASREESLTLSNLHRIIRRGRPYGKPLDRSMSVAAMLAQSVAAGEQALEVPSSSLEVSRRGLQFLCFNANIERQFEFIQQQWCNNPKFAGLNNDPDPLLGLRRPPGELGLDGAGFTLQSDVKAGVRGRCTELQQFVKVVGSGYFFMPSLPAVRLLGAGLLAAQPDPALESRPPDEQLHIDSLIATLGDKMKCDYAAGRTLRDAHPKLHGCVQALFHVEPSLPAELRVGLFAEPRTYSAWVRFSNASGKVEHDEVPDIRGVAIKLMGVEGYKLLEGAESCTSHDFLLISHDAFVSKDVAEFDALTKALIRGKLALVLFALTRPRVAVNLLRALQRHSSPLEIQYFSVAPYLLGSGAVKYTLRPSAPDRTPLPKNPEYNFLRAALKAKLSKGSASFDFMVQRRTQPERMPVEDPGVAWRERDAPFQKVATLLIPQQTFDLPARQEFGDNLSFNPWRCLPEHRPLGGISRARRQVYRALSSLRHGRNAALELEPQEGASLEPAGQGPQ